MCNWPYQKSNLKDEIVFTIEIKQAKMAIGCKDEMNYVDELWQYGIW